MFTGRNAWKGAVYDRTENERNADNPLAWMLESELYKRENPSGSHACNGCKMKKNHLTRLCRFLAREEIAYRYPIIYEMIQKMFSPDDTNPPEACTMFMPDNEPDDEEYAMAA